MISYQKELNIYYMFYFKKALKCEIYKIKYIFYLCNFLLPKKSIPKKKKIINDMKKDK